MSDQKDPNENREGYELHDGKWHKVLQPRRAGWWRYHLDVWSANEQEDVTMSDLAGATWPEIRAALEAKDAEIADLRAKISWPAEERLEAAVAEIERLQAELKK